MMDEDRLVLEIYEPLRLLTALCHEIALEHGWWEDGKGATPTESMALFMYEIAEAGEEIREGHALDEIYYKQDDNGIPKPEGVVVELADSLIRIMDFLGKHELYDLFVHALVGKIRYNETRDYRHGGKIK